MDQARSTIFKIINGEPHSYTRFNLTQNMEGDNSQVEMKLASAVDEEGGENGVGDHLNHSTSRQPYVAQKLGRSPKNLCFLAAATLLIFIIGYLIGYLVHRKKDLSPISPDFDPVEKTFPIIHETGAATPMNWDRVKNLLANKISPSKLESVFREFSSSSHQAGSTGDEVLRTMVVDKFTEYGMKTWTDDHYVKVQIAPAAGSNRIVFKGQTSLPKGFLSYSANGTVTSTVVYAHYGRQNDLMSLAKKLNMSGKVVLVRAGLITFAEKVYNAAKMNASGVLIYADPSDLSMEENTELYGHVHMGSGDPYTPGFPSFNHSQFPPVQSSGLPKILAQTITPGMATKIMRQLGGQSAPAEWGCFNKLGDESDDITLVVNNVLTEKKINNIFGVIQGLVDADRYVVIGAQRDAWGPGFAASTVGTGILLELARSISEMVEYDGFKPRRSIVFASWSAGEYGSVGTTEWLEAHLTTLNMKAFTFINLDSVVSGYGRFKVAASPLLHSLIESTLKEVNSPNKGRTLFSEFGQDNWENNVLEPLKMDNAAYPFLAFSGIPSISFRFMPRNKEYPFFGTMLDTPERLSMATSGQLNQLAVLAAKFAGHMALKLVHDHLLQMDLLKYNDIIRSHVYQINVKVRNIKRMQPQLFSKALTVQWLISAAGAYSRAMEKLSRDIEHSDTDNIEKCRLLNDRIMAVERNFLSPYVSPRDSPYRHILLGSDSYTLAAVSQHLDHLQTNHPDADADLFRYQFGLATWTIQGCANALAGHIWSLGNEI
ncbi:hypothetical protein JOB18_040221 [Solea senegalensis]|uniref:Transferrin receptor protein 1 n=1 Tax=Solea senegalensis TaxID=28829 RepID=A0AAV6TA47_SOLSE|nr:transferrin receptor 1a [Solea senegalensis]KAG7526438.1 hypothetical protein JOB18_040221 [Solea senegalensis]